MAENTDDGLKQAPLEKLEKSALEINSREALFLPYEVFKQYNALVTENMKQIYNMLHQMTTARTVTVEFSFGDVNFAMSGPESELERLTDKSEDMMKTILRRLTSKSVIKAIRTENKEVSYDDRKGYG